MDDDSSAVVSGPSAVSTIIAGRLAQIRHSRGLSQAQLGKAIGRPQNRIAQLETGAVRLLFAEAVDLAHVLRVDIGAFDPTGPDEISPRRLLSPFEFAETYGLTAYGAPAEHPIHGNIAGEREWSVTFICGSRDEVARVVLDERVRNPQPGYLLAVWLEGDSRTWYERDEKPRNVPTTQVRLLLGPERFRVLATSVDVNPARSLEQQLRFESGELPPAPSATAQDPYEIKTIEILAPGRHELASVEAQLRSAADQLAAVELDGWQPVGVQTGLDLTIGRPQSAPAQKAR